jgi:hypothetical protein
MNALLTGVILRSSRRLLLGLLVFAAGCASARVHQPEVHIRVVNGARYAMDVRVCSPYQCSEYRRIAPGASGTFSFPWKGARRHMITGKDGNRVAIQVPIDFLGPGRRTVILVPPYHPQQSASTAARQTLYRGGGT